MRTFIAIELPSALQDSIQQIQSRLQVYLSTCQLTEGIRWAPVAKTHLTLRFLGETSASQHEIITHQLAQVALQQADLHLTLGRLGCFPNFALPTVIWLGLGGEVVALQHLQQQIEQLARESAFAPEPKPFAPHITLGRTPRHADGAEIHRIGAALQGFQLEVEPRQQPMGSSAQFVVNRIVYMQSELRAEGAHYTPLGHYRFK